MNKDFYSIGEVAKMMNLSTKALRNYDQLGLLKPSYIDKETRYRYYTYDQFFLIDIIKYLNKILFIPLEVIQEIFTNKTSNEALASLLEQHRRRLNEEISKYQYAEQLVSNFIEEQKDKSVSRQLNPHYDSYIMSRRLYYKELNVPLEEIDKYVNRGDLSYVNYQNIENDTMCLIFSLDHYLKSGKLIVKGFGIFSNKKIDSLSYKLIPEGRFLNYRFKYSETDCEKVLETILKHGREHNRIYSDDLLLISKTVDFNARDKYDYLMTFQVRYNLSNV